MSTTRKIAHNTLSQMIGKIISVALGLLAIGMMTRYLGQEQFGWYITTISFLQFIGILVDFGLIPVTAQMMSEPAFDKKELLKNLLGYRFVTALVFLLPAPFIALLFPYPHEVKIAISFTTISFLCISMNQIFVGYYQTKLKMHIQAIGEVLGRIALVISLFILIAKGSSFLWIMGAVVLAAVVYTTFLWIYAAKDASVSFGFDMKMWKVITAKMWPIAIAVIFNVVYLKGDVILLSIFRQQSEVGLYGAAYRVIDILAQTAMMIMGIMLPLLAYSWSRNLKDEFRQRFQQSFDTMMALAIPMALGTIVLAKKIMILIAGKEFAVAGKPLQILAIAVFGVFLGAVFGHTAVAVGKQKQVMWIYISAAVLTLIGYLIFIPTYGMYGAAYMTVFSEIYVGVLLFFAVRHYTKESLQIKALAKIIFSGLVMAATLMILQNFHILLLVPIGIVVYGFFLFALGGVSKETLKEILTPKK